MSINGRFPLGYLTLADITAEAVSWPFDGDTAEHAAVETIERVRAAAAALASEQLAATVVARCDALLAGRPAGG